MGTRGREREGAASWPICMAAGCHHLDPIVLGELEAFAASVAPHPGPAWVTIGSSLQGGLGVFVQLMPILILILVSALSQLMVSSPPYSLSLRP